MGQYFGLITLPLLRGTIATPGPWQTFYARSGWRVYPYQLGSAAAADVSAGSSVPVSSYAEYAANDYVLLCRKRDYGASSMFVPDMNSIARIVSFGDDASTDPGAATGTVQLNLDRELTVAKGDWLLCLGTDSAPAPEAGPEYDGSRVELYLDPGGDEESPLPYLLTGLGGYYRGWVDSGREAVDLLVLDGTGTPRVAIPLTALGPEVMG